jgi:hypothetical protein
MSGILTPGSCSSSIVCSRDQTRILQGELYDCLHLFEINQRSYSNDGNPFCPAELKPSGNSIQRTELSQPTSPFVDPFQFTKA